MPGFTEGHQSTNSAASEQQNNPGQSPLYFQGLSDPVHNSFEKERLIQDMPPDIVELIARTDQCMVYLREPPLPNESSLVRDSKMKGLRCTELRGDLEWLAERYAASEAVRTTLKQLDEHYPH